MPAKKKSSAKRTKNPIKENAELCYAEILRDIDAETATERGGRTTEDSVALEDYCNKLFEAKNFKGVFPRDQIPKLMAGQGCIVNNQVLAEGGEHWLGLAMFRDGKLLQYDSFGRANFLKLSEGTSKDTERDVEQAVKEVNCGNRCAAFLAVFFWLGEKYAVHILKKDPSLRVPCILF